MRLKPYLLVFKAHLTKAMSYRFNFLFAYVLHVTRLLIYLTVWATIFAQGQTLDTYTWNEIASYYVLTTMNLSAN